ncbi:4'-phosphopantetheinyl transferase family protein [Paenibacillus faecalis]|uniref:4'-phosphopantetheinyl transferase family protein n=1 Tax=Paenibacillus faecalis TaxID=2079532 RepID=UPI000D0E396F|nr:4'-phosphopantetheinyl transferase superfamily protein [Paenibacillus faecalis]
MEIYAVKVPEFINPVVYHQLLKIVDQSKQRKIEKFMKKEDKYRGLLSDLLIRRLVACKTSKPIHSIKFVYNKFGKPFIDDCDIMFNLSHSGKWVVCVLGETCVGIDVEEITPIDFNICKYVFSEQEYQQYLLQPQELQKNFFFDIWTLKESFVKALGLGLSIPPNSFSMNINNMDGHISIVQNISNDTFYFKQYLLEDTYKLSVCSVRQTFPDSFEMINVNEILYNHPISIFEV